MFSLFLLQFSSLLVTLRMLLLLLLLQEVTGRNVLLIVADDAGLEVYKLEGG